MRRASRSAATWAKKPRASPATTDSSMARSSRSTIARDASVFGSGSPKRGPTWARSTPATRHTRRDEAATVSRRASRKRGTRESASGSVPAHTASLRYEASTGRMVNGRRAERGVVRLEGDRERVGHPGVAGAQDDVEIRVRAVKNFLIRRAISRPPAVKINVRSDQGREGPRLRAGPGGDGSRPLHVGKESGDLLPQRRGLARIGAARVSRGPHRAPPEGVVDGAATRPEPLAVEEPRVVEPLDQRGDLLDRGRLAVAAPQDLADPLDRVLPVEEGDQVEQGARQHRDLLGEAGGVTQRDAALPFVLHRKGLDSPQARIAGAGHSASR